MPLERWNDGRLDDLKARVDTHEAAIKEVVEHDVTLEEHTRTLKTINASQGRLADKLDAASAAKRWTPAAIGPIVIASLAVVGTILTKGGAG